MPMYSKTKRPQTQSECKIWLIRNASNLTCPTLCYTSSRNNYITRLQSNKRCMVSLVLVNQHYLATYSMKGSMYIDSLHKINGSMRTGIHSQMTNKATAKVAQLAPDNQSPHVRMRARISHRVVELVATYRMKETACQSSSCSVALYFT